MAGGLAALLDDVALIAKKAAATVDDVAAAAGRTSAKAAGVVVDDAAVTPKFVQGVTPARELPIIFRIGRGSLFNKLVIILPLALLLSWLAPWALMPLLMVGGFYLSFEGAEKVAEKLGIIDHHDTENEKVVEEDALVKQAILTDFILSAEIMVISLNEVATEPFLNRTLILIVVALAITLGVYGFVGLLVKIDDIGLRLIATGKPAAARFGRGLVTAMPKVLNTIAVIGTFAMLWVGGHILLVGTHDLGLAQPYGFVHHLEGLVAGIAGVGGVLAWLINTFFSFVIGLIVGALVAVIVHFLPFGHHGGAETTSASADGTGQAQGGSGPAQDGHSADRPQRGDGAAST